MHVCVFAAGVLVQTDSRPSSLTVMEPLLLLCEKAEAELWQEGLPKPDVDVLFAQAGQLRSGGLSCYICSLPKFNQTWLKC